MKTCGGGNTKEIAQRRELEVNYGGRGKTYQSGQHLICDESRERTRTKPGAIH